MENNGIAKSIILFDLCLGVVELDMQKLQS